MKGYPVHNVVAVATFKLLMTEFVIQWHLDSQDDLTVKLYDYVH